MLIDSLINISPISSLPTLYIVYLSRRTLPRVVKPFLSSRCPAGFQETVSVKSREEGVVWDTMATMATTLPALGTTHWSSECEGGGVAWVQSGLQNLDS